MAVAKRSYDGNMLSVLAVRRKHLSMKSADDRPQAFSPRGMRQKRLLHLPTRDTDHGLTGRA